MPIRLRLSKGRRLRPLPLLWLLPWVRLQPDVMPKAPRKRDPDPGSLCDDVRLKPDPQPDEGSQEPGD